MDDLAILIPVFNEAPTIAAVVADYAAVFPQAKIYVYDNNSTDGSAQLAAQAGAIVRHEPQQGKGHVIRRMLREVDARAYLITDGDNTYPASQARLVVAPVLENGADMVIGDRLSGAYARENKRRFHAFGNNLVRFAINFLFGSDIKDIMTGLRACSFEFAKTLPVLSSGFEIETEMSIHAVDKKMSLRNVTIDYRDRVPGSESKLHTFSDGARVLRTIIKLYRCYKPLHFFGSIAIFLLVLALIFVWPIVVEFYQTGLVPRFPTLIVCGFVTIAAIQSLFAGLILSGQVAKNRQDFEYRLLAVSREKKQLLEADENGK